MITLDYDRSKVVVKPVVLDRELRLRVPGFVGLSWTDGLLRVHLVPDGAVDMESLEGQVDDVLRLHDPMTPDIEEEKQAALAADRVTFAAALDPENITLGALARRVAWLEREIRDLRGM